MGESPNLGSYTRVTRVICGLVLHVPITNITMHTAIHSNILLVYCSVYRSRILLCMKYQPICARLLQCCSVLRSNMRTRDQQVWVSPGGRTKRSLTLTWVLLIASLLSEITAASWMLRDPLLPWFIHTHVYVIFQHVYAYFHTCTCSCGMMFFRPFTLYVCAPVNILFIMATYICAHILPIYTV